MLATLQVRIQVAESLVSSNNILAAVRVALERGLGLAKPALQLLLACCRVSPAVCEAAALAHIPQVSRAPGTSPPPPPHKDGAHPWLMLEALPTSLQI